MTGALPPTATRQLGSDVNASSTSTKKLAFFIARLKHVHQPIKLSVFWKRLKTFMSDDINMQQSTWHICFTYSNLHRINDINNNNNNNRLNYQLIDQSINVSISQFEFGCSLLQVSIRG